MNVQISLYFIMVSIFHILVIECLIRDHTKVRSLGVPSWAIIGVLPCSSMKVEDARRRSRHVSYWVYKS